MHHKEITFFSGYARRGFITDGLENEADTFAMNLLIGDDILVEYEGYTIGEVSRFLGYERRLVELRLK